MKAHPMEHSSLRTQRIRAHHHPVFVLDGEDAGPGDDRLLRALAGVVVVGVGHRLHQRRLRHLRRLPVRPVLRQVRGGLLSGGVLVVRHSFPCVLEVSVEDEMKSFVETS